jgi:hypothetical protein
MDVAIRGGVMAKAKGRPKKPGGEGAVVRIDPDLAAKARYLSAQRSVPLSEYLSEMIRPTIEREMRKAGKKLIEGEGE